MNAVAKFRKDIIKISEHDTYFSHFRHQIKYNIFLNKIMNCSEILAIFLSYFPTYEALIRNLQHRSVFLIEATLLFTEFFLDFVLYLNAFIISDMT